MIMIQRCSILAHNSRLCILLQQDSPPAKQMVRWHLFKGMFTCWTKASPCRWEAEVGCVGCGASAVSTEKPHIGSLFQHVHSPHWLGHMLCWLGKYHCPRQAVFFVKLFIVQAEKSFVSKGRSVWPKNRNTIRINTWCGFDWPIPFHAEVWGG